ncbi:inner-membrane translocator [Streptomyces sp. JV178]|nr:inner-membrane translocator [Streptomyces sp. JV178]
MRSDTRPDRRPGPSQRSARSRALGRMDAGAGQRASDVLPPDWGPAVGFGALALVVGLTAVALVWIGHRVIGAVQLTLCVVLIVHALGCWP